MRKTSFNKLDKTTCSFCNVTEIPASRWNLRCDDCKMKLGRERIKNKPTVRVGRRMPAAVVTEADGRQVFVDKHGKEVKDHGYNIEDDPHGWKATGKLKQRPTLIK